MSRTFVEAHDGAVSVASKEGLGSTFPLHAAAAAKTPPPLNAPAKEMKNAARISCPRTRDELIRPLSTGRPRSREAVDAAAPVRALQRAGILDRRRTYGPPAHV
jgi:hypothetical protein